VNHQTTHDIRLQYKPRKWQRACHVVGKRFSVLALHRRAGKTELAIMRLIDKALRQTKADGISMYVYLAPYLKQAKAIAWARLKEKVEPLRRAAAVEVSEGELTVRFLNGAAIRIFGADNPDAMRGLRLDGVVVDEVAWIKPEVWYEILQPALADRLGWALFIGTPYGVNLFSELYHLAERLSDWHAASWTVYETEALDPGEVSRMRESMPEAAFAREMLCDFTAAGDDQLISLSDVMEAAGRVYTEVDVYGASVILGVDPARFGDDRSTIVRRKGLQMFDPLIYTGIDNMGLAARVAGEIERWKPDAVFIDSGAGAGVIDRLRQLHFTVIEVPFGGKATKPHMFINRRTEMWCEMADWLRSGGAIPAEDHDLHRELATPIYWYDAAQRKVLEPKDDIKKRLPGAGSPDIADGLALTFSHPVSSSVRRPEQAQRPVMAEFDPYSDI
jgi:hypothetical protein